MSAAKPTTASYDRKGYGSSIQFLLSCIGMAVGLGNIWRFPSLAYENGGTAFLIPYCTCSMLFSLPTLYFEFSIGQYANASAGVIYGRIRPYAKGLGYAMIYLAGLGGVFYNVVIAWVLVYLYFIVTGQSEKWFRCDNDWNTPNCVSLKMNKDCAKNTNSSKPFHFNGNCYATSNFSTSTTINAVEEFLQNYVFKISGSIDGLQDLNYPSFIGLAVAWLICALAACKGVWLVGRLSYVTSTLPYIIIAILFGRGITLDGASDGIKFYFQNFDLSKAFSIEAWSMAAVQSCYSLTIGFGCLMTYASFNKPSHNCLRDAVIIVLADSFMSIFGGAVVFAVLGFMAKRQNKAIENVVASGRALIFVVYPEVIGQMDFFPSVWSFFFFLMLFLLGVSSLFGATQATSMLFLDQFPTLRKRQSLVVFGICFVSFLLSTIMTTRAGIYYFTIMDVFAFSFSVPIMIIGQLVIVGHVYGIDKYVADLRTLFGRPGTGFFARFFGYTGTFFQFTWTITAPLFFAAMTGYFLNHTFHANLTYGQKGSSFYYEFPTWTFVLGWFLAFSPVAIIAGFGIAAVIKNARKGFPRSELWVETFRTRDPGGEELGSTDYPARARLALRRWNKSRKVAPIK